MNDPRRYLAKCPPATEGGRNDALNRVAHAVAERFALPALEFESLLLEWAASCSPPMNEFEAAKTIRSAYNAVKGRGELGAKGHGNGHPTYTPSAAKPAQKYELASGGELPAGMTDGARALLESAFKPGEYIRIVGASLDTDGHETPDGEGPTLSREEWLRRLGVHKGDPNGIWSSKDKAGIYLAINPLRKGGTKDAEVTSFRHALLEFDAIALADQWQLFQQSNIPCAAIIYSGGKSIHAWVRVDAVDRQEYDDRVKALYAHFAAYGADAKNKNPSRLSRLPNCVRFDKRQELLALNIGAKSWTEWAEAQKPDGWPQILSAKELLMRETIEPDQILTGVLYRGDKMTLAGTSKAKKTWALINLAMAVANGVNWWGIGTLASSVLYVNFELRDFVFARRMKWIAESLGIAAGSPNLSYWGLRGKATSIDEMAPNFLAGIKDAQYKLIVIDPIYKALGGRDENSAGDVTDMLNHIERLGVASGAAVVFGAHFSKGNQASKVAMDRVSGSGAFARDADALVTMTEQEEKGKLTIEFSLRNFATVEPFVVDWQFPVFRRDDGADPKALKTPKRDQKYSDEKLMEFVAAALAGNSDLSGFPDGLPKANVVKVLRKQTGQSQPYLYTRLDSLINTGKLVSTTSGEISLP